MDESKAKPLTEKPAVLNLSLEQLLLLEDILIDYAAETCTCSFWTRISPLVEDIQHQIYDTKTEIRRSEESFLQN